jgi:hypothetical protein
LQVVVVVLLMKLLLEVPAAALPVLLALLEILLVEAAEHNLLVEHLCRVWVLLYRAAPLVAKAMAAVQAEVEAVIGVEALDQTRILAQEAVAVLHIMTQ